MSEELAPLTTERRIAAVLDGQGQRRDVIAKTIGVSESAIARWRREPAYRQELEKYQAITAANVSTLIEEVREESVKGALAGIRTLVDALDATTKDGKPFWMVRLQAAIALQKAVNAFPSQGPEGGGGGGASSSAAIIVMMNDKGEMRRKHDDEDVIEHASIVVPDDN